MWSRPGQDTALLPLTSPQFVSQLFTDTPSISPALRRQMVDPEDELRNFQSDSVPSEVREWLASTFTRQTVLPVRGSEDKPRFRSIVHAVQASIFVERSWLVPLLLLSDQCCLHREDGRREKTLFLHCVFLLAVWQDVQTSVQRHGPHLSR